MKVSYNKGGYIIEVDAEEMGDLISLMWIAARMELCEENKVIAQQLSDKLDQDCSELN